MTRKRRRCRRVACEDTRFHLECALDEIERLKQEIEETKKFREEDQDRHAEELGKLLRGD